MRMPWRFIMREVLAIFEGPWSYVTASWYPNRDMPSTYYYTAVHCFGTIELQDEPALGASLEDLVQRSEADYPDGWKTSEVPRSEITRRFAGHHGISYPRKPDRSQIQARPG